MKQSFTRRLLSCLCMIAVLSVMACSIEHNEAGPGSANENEHASHVVILATSDMHGNILGYSYEDNAETKNNGMARLYTYIRQVRAEEPVTFLIDAGDDIQGTIMTDDFANKNPDDEHPVMSAMNYMGYDTMTLGNHEFNWGIPTLKKIIGQADFPVLAANVRDRDGNYVSGNGWVIIERGGIRLAVIGVCTPSIPVWDGEKEGIKDTTFEAANEAVKKAVEEIGDQADIIAVSAHMGQYAEYDEDGGSDSGQKIIEDNPDVDLLQVAHMHITVDDRVNGVPVVGVRNSGREIARIDIDLDADKNIKSISTGIVDMENYEPSEEIGRIPVVKKLHEETLNHVWGANEDGEKTEPLGSTTARFQPEDEIKGLPEGRLRDTAVIDLILKIQLLNSGADVTSASLFKDDSDLPEGVISYRDILDIYKYDNTLYTVDVTGKELKAYMEWAAECYNQWKAGDINISFDPDYPGYRCDMFGGVEYEINLSKPKGERIENVIYQGKPLEDDRILKLAVTNFRYASALKAEKLIEGKRDWESSNSVRDMIVEYFAKNSPVEPVVDNNWRITGVDLSEDDPRRAEIISYINEGRLPTPCDESYNLKDYDALVAEAK